MKFTPQFLDEIRARVSISAVVGRAVTWDRRKTNARRGDYWACCPFHGEKTPSFHVEDEKGRYHCFGCKASGDIFTFLVEREGLSFPDAVERLAGDAGLRMPEQSPEERRKAAVRASLHEVMVKAAAFFSEQFLSPGGAAARDYVTARGIGPDMIRAFGIGYAPATRAALRTALSAQGVTDEQMIEAGLLVAPQSTGTPIDRFRDRVMFPIRDQRGRVIAFGGRALASDAMAKYLNSPETPLFHKGETLFNMDRARAEAHRASSLFVVEGYIDVIAMTRAGFPQAVAPLGTALTPEQLASLWKVVPEPVLCFDGDKAGRLAATRAMDLAIPALRPGRSVSFCMLPDGADPDDLLRAKGAAAVAEALSHQKPLLDLLWDRAVAENDRATPERAARFEQDILATVARIEDRTVRDHYRKAVRARIDQLFAVKAPRYPVAGGAGRPTRGPRGAAASDLLGALASLEKRAAAMNQLREEGCFDEDL